VWPNKPPIDTLNKVKVLETWEQFSSYFDLDAWACVEDVPFKWQRDQKVWLHLLVFIASDEVFDSKRL